MAADARCGDRARARRCGRGEAAAAVVGVDGRAACKRVLSRRPARGVRGSAACADGRRERTQDGRHVCDQRGLRRAWAVVGAASGADAAGESDSARPLGT